MTKRQDRDPMYLERQFDNRSVYTPKLRRFGT